MEFGIEFKERRLLIPRASFLAHGGVTSSFATFQLFPDALGRKWQFYSCEFQTVFSTAFRTLTGNYWGILSFY
jgi:hypothetical protein